MTGSLPGPVHCFSATAPGALSGAGIDVRGRGRGPWELTCRGPGGQGYRGPEAPVGTGGRGPRVPFMTTARSLLLFVLAALAEIGGCWLVWQGVREHRGWLWAAAGVLALGGYGFVAAFQPDAQFGRVLAAYGGVFVAGSLVWGMVADGFRPAVWDWAGAAVCLAGVGLIMYAPRG